jgi:hypothetical protein
MTFWHLTCARGTAKVAGSNGKNGTGLTIVTL